MARRIFLIAAAVRKRINAEGGDPVTSTPEEHTADLDSEKRSGMRSCASSI
jgi:hypothetical protein